MTLELSITINEKNTDNSVVFLNLKQICGLRLSESNCV